MHRGNIFLSFLLAFVSVLLLSCSTTVMGPAQEVRAVYFLGDMEAAEAKSINFVYDAAVKAMDDLKLSVSHKTQDALSAKIIAHDSQDRKITVKLYSVAEKSTKIIVRAGFFGDETKSRLIYRRILDNLQ